MLVVATPIDVAEQAEPSLHTALLQAFVWKKKISNQDSVCSNCYVVHRTTANANYYCSRVGLAREQLWVTTPPKLAKNKIPHSLQPVTRIHPLVPTSHHRIRYELGPTEGFVVEY